MQYPHSCAKADLALSRVISHQHACSLHFDQSCDAKTVLVVTKSYMSILQLGTYQGLGWCLTIWSATSMLSLAQIMT